MSRSKTYKNLDEIYKDYPKISLGQADNIEGKTFGKLTPIYRTDNKNRKTVWICKCECGNYLPVLASNLKKGNTLSCGCFHSAVASAIHFQDLSGQQFGYWTVLARAFKKEKDEHTFYLCKCVCNKEKVVAASALTSGDSKSCGCQKSSLLSEYGEDLTGRVFGKLTVLQKIEREDYSQPVKFLCKCECGNLTNVRADLLRNGMTKSCGCLRHQPSSHLNDLVGKRFGKLVVTERDFSQTSRTFWKCQCDCGSIKSIAAYSLTSGRTLSCGCINSKGEEKIIELLQKNNIKFEIQKTFETCRFSDTNALARFDFYLPEYNILIEYDGEQHFNPQCFNGISGFDAQKNFKKTQEHDKFKNQWCKDNGIRLVRIPYTSYNSIQIKDLLINEKANIKKGDEASHEENSNNRF